MSMNLTFQKYLSTPYTNNAQKIRAMSEPWTLKNWFCPNCGSKLTKLKNNKKVSDFLCKNCLENFEQKASKKKFKWKTIAGEYNTYVKKLKGKNKPNFFFLYYLDWIFSVNDFFVVPKYFFVPEIIEKRSKWLKNRPNYYMCNILFDKIPNSWKIYYVENWKEISKEKVLEKWQKTAFLKDIKKDNLKGWILDIMNIVESLNKEKFSLKEIYSFEKDLKVLHPENKNIKAKIRQQLQFLRNKWYLEFLEKRGNYRIL